MPPYSSESKSRGKRVLFSSLTKFLKIVSYKWRPVCTPELSGGRTAYWVLENIFFDEENKRSRDKVFNRSGKGYFKETV
jgi:hypothetical protein